MNLTLSTRALCAKTQRLAYAFSLLRGKFGTTLSPVNQSWKGEPENRQGVLFTEKSRHPTLKASCIKPDVKGGEGKDHTAIVHLQESPSKRRSKLSL